MKDGNDAAAQGEATSELIKGFLTFSKRDLCKEKSSPQLDSTILKSTSALIHFYFIGYEILFFILLLGSTTIQIPAFKHCSQTSVVIAIITTVQYLSTRILRSELKSLQSTILC